MSHHCINMSHHISFDPMVRLIDLMVKISLCMVKDLSHLCTIDLAENKIQRAIKVLNGSASIQFLGGDDTIQMRHGGT
jgi:hypothetical protein